MAQSKHNLLDLVDDCLLKVCSYLTVSELADIASSCTRFQSVARDAFSARHKTIGLEIDLNSNSIERRQQAAAILRSFGDLAKNLRVTFSREENAKLYNSHVFNVMVMYSAGTLEILKLALCNKLKPHKVICPSELFRNVEELNWEGPFPDVGSYLANAKQLIRLTLNEFSSISMAKLLSNDFPKLEALSLNNITGRDRDSVDIVHFLKRHPNVAELVLCDGWYNLASIGECTSLRKLSIWLHRACRFWELKLKELDKLIALKMEQDLFSTRSQHILKFLMVSKSRESLERLIVEAIDPNDGKQFILACQRLTSLIHLSCVFYGLEVEDIDNNLLHEFHHLKQLRVLSIGGKLSITSDGLVNFLECVPDLERFCLHHGFQSMRIELKESTYLRICAIYRNRKQKLVIYNFDETDEEENVKERKEPFAGAGQREFVQYISVDHPNWHQIFEI